MTEPPTGPRPPQPEGEGSPPPPQPPPPGGGPQYQPAPYPQGPLQPGTPQPGTPQPNPYQPQPYQSGGHPPPSGPKKGSSVLLRVLGGVIAVAVVVAIGVAVRTLADSSDDTGERDADGNIDRKQDMSVFAVHEGDCLDDETLEALGAEQSSEVQDVQAIPCDEPHTLEAFHVFEIEGDDYPGRPEVERLSEEGCFSAFKSFIGVPPAKSRLAYYFLYPQEQTWTELDDRQVVCLVGEGDSSPITGSLEGAKR